MRILKEIGLSLSIGIVLSVLISTYVVTQKDPIIYAAIISTALTVVVVIAALIGTLVPLILDKYDIDPAIATGPFITTTNDILGVFIYFSIAHVFLN
jgi:magnesium transporter